MNVSRYFQLLEQYEAAQTDEQKRLILAEIEKEQGINQQLLTEDN